MKEVFEKYPELADAWLNIDVDRKRIYNPLMDIPLEYQEPELMPLYVTWLFTRVEYISFFCKHVLNIDLLPTQALFIKHMWDRKFPMLIGTRGFGKAQPLNTKVLTSKNWVKIGDLKVGDLAFGRDGRLHKITHLHPQGKKQVYRVELYDGRTIDCCEDHLWTVKNQAKEKVLSTKEMLDSGLHHFGKDGRLRAYKYKIPNCEPIEFPKKDLPLDPYILGCMLGDADMVHSTPRLSTNDDFILDEFKSRLKGFKFTKDPTNNNYAISDRNKQYEDLGMTTIADGYSRNRLTRVLEQLNLRVGCKDKFIPEEYKYSSIKDRYEIVRGLMDTDGSINTNGSIEFTNTCERLVDDLIDILRSLGITCIKSTDKRAGQTLTYPQGTQGTRTTYFRLHINTSKQIFKLPRKLERLKKESTGREKYVAIKDIKVLDKYEEMQCITVDNPDSTYITEDYTVTHNSFLLSLYALLRAILLPGRKVAICGAAFRQSKILFGYMQKIYDNAPILRDIIHGYGQGMGPFKGTDLVGFKIGQSQINCFPLGDGQKIRGQRANDVIADEFATINRDIFETVIAGFAIVRNEPVEAVQRQAALDYARKHNIELPKEFYEEDAFVKSNQIIISGTAYYSINHFAEYWRMWKAWVLSRGDMQKYYDLVGKDYELIDQEEKDQQSSQDWRDYCVFRIPYEKIPKGFMDEGQRNRARASITKSAYEMEYGAVFSKDSDGFFKFSAIEAATTDPKKKFYHFRPDGGFSHFIATRYGEPGCKYVMGVDPASEVDRFSIVIIEIKNDHRRVVYGWSTNKAEHRARIKHGKIDEHNYFAFCAMKIRELTKQFNIERIAIDSQGGGYQIEEALHDTDKLNHEEGDLPFWRVVNDDKPQESDVYVGPKILDMVNFANYEWLSTANHSLKKDISDKTLLFPYYDGAALVTDESNSMDPDKVCYDTLEDVFDEIEELKRELITIVISITPSGRERWDTPEIKQAHGTKGRARKDRYSALLLANMAAKDVTPHIFSEIDRAVSGGYARTADSDKELENPGYKLSPEWAKKQTSNDLFDMYGAL